MQRQYALLEKFYDEKHDRYNRMKVLYELIASGDQQTALTVLKGWMTCPTDGRGKAAPATGDRMVDAVLRVKLAEAGDVPLHIHINGYFPTGNHEELAMVLANLLDNAIAATRLAERPEITMSLTIKYGLLKGVIVNSRAVQHVSSAPGRGLSIVRKTLQRYHGRLEIKETPESYQVDLLAYLNIDEASDKPNAL